jgi:hypothetical protein
MLDGMASRCPRSGQRKLPGERPGRGIDAFVIPLFHSVCVSSFYRCEHKCCLAFGSKLAHGHFWRQPQSDRGVLTRIQVQSLLFRTSIFCYSKTVGLKKDSVQQSVYIYMLPRIGLAVAALSSSQGFCRFEPGCGDRDTSVFFGTVDGRRVPSACFTVHRPLRGLFLFSAACATWCCFRHLVTSRDL